MKICEALPNIYCFCIKFNKFTNTGAHILDSIAGFLSYMYQSHADSFCDLVEV